MAMRSSLPRKRSQIARVGPCRRKLRVEFEPGPQSLAANFDDRRMLQRGQRVQKIGAERAASLDQAFIDQYS